MIGTDERCGMERAERVGSELFFIRCPKPARWKHPRYPEGGYCDAHKQLIAHWLPDGWSPLEGEKSGPSEKP
jgi:hypothetical protein